MSIYKHLDDYEPVFLDPGDQFMSACCDCGLVHLMQFLVIDADGNQVEDHGIAIRFIRKKQSTAQLRRHEYGLLHRGKNWILRRRT